MTTTIEEKIDSLTQGMAAIASELNGRNAAPAGGMKFNTDPNLGPVAHPKISLTENIADYDFSTVESARGCKVVSIVRYPKFGAAKANGNAPLTLLTVQMADGKTPMVKVPFTRGQKNEPAPDPTPARAPLPVVTHLRQDNDDDLVAYCAANLNRRHSADAANETFYAEMHARGRAYCAAKVKPLLASHPYPAGADLCQKLVHTRALLTKLAPQAVQVAALVARVIGQEGTRERFESDAELRHTFMGRLDLYLTYTISQGGVAAHAARLEQSLSKTRPRFVNGKWIVAEISAFHKEWLASKALQFEFPSPECYDGYRRRVDRYQPAQ
jgi:hypothetical protein